MVAKVLMAGVATLVSAGATFGAMTGGVAFLLRNNASAIGMALALAALAAAIAAAVVLWPREVNRGWALRVGAFLLSGALLGLALALVVRTQAELASSGSRPVIEAEWVGGVRVPTLMVTAKADGLAINDRLFANVLAYPRGQDAFINYYSGFTGPDINGHSEQRVAVPVPLTETETVNGVPTTFPIGSVMVAAIVEKQQSVPLIEPGHGIGVTCEGEVYASDSGHKVSESGARVRRTTKPACVYLQSVVAPGSSGLTLASAKAPPVVVPGAAPWTDSQIYVRQGQRLVVHASGRIGVGQGGQEVDPNGTTGVQSGDTVLPGPDHYGALIGRINGVVAGPPFLVGADFSTTADRSGLLVLGVNDLGTADNVGRFLVQVDLGR